MAMAYCKTCGCVGNFIQCPMRNFPEDDGTYLLHRVEFDEVHDDDNNDSAGNVQHPPTNGNNQGSDG